MSMKIDAKRYTPHAGDRKPRRRGWLRTILLAPFRFCWWMASRFERATGILFTLLVGTLLLAAGIFLSTTLLGFIVGVPMAIAGAFLLLRGLY